MVFTTLAHLIDVELLREAYKRTRKDSSPGVDGVTAKQYGANLEANLSNLHERLRKQQYYAPPVKRTYLEKEDGSKRPIGNRCKWMLRQHPQKPTASGNPAAG